MVCSVYKILLVSSVAVLLFVQFSTSSPLYDGSMVIQPKTTSTNRRRFSTNTNDDNNRKIYTKTEKPVTGSENDATKSKIALMVEKKLISKSLSEADRINLDEQNHFEGDILMKGPKMSPRAGTSRNNIWPNKTIPYQIQEDKYDKGAIDVILEAMKSIESKTCLRFIKRTTQNDYILISPISGCSSGVGKSGGAQNLSLTKGCIHLKIIKHELMHAIGFWHEQSRTDRDEHVIIHIDNIIENRAYNFDKYHNGHIQLRTPYDYRSLMHYGPHYFAKDHKPTISGKNGEKVGLSDDFTETDILDINRLYQCRKNGLGEYVSQR